MSDQMSTPAEGSGQGAGAAAPAPAEDECTSCVGARGVLLAFAFAAFAAYVAADFATGGKLTAAVAGALAAARSRGGDDER